MGDNKSHSKYSPAEDCQLWELAIEYPPLYEALEGFLVETINTTDPKTLKGIINAFQKTEKETFKKIAFERILNDRYGDNVKEILRLLNETHGSTFTPRRVPLGLNFITDERQLELVVLNIIAGAIIAYHIPEIYKDDGMNAGALKQLYPRESCKIITETLRSNPRR